MRKFIVILLFICVTLLLVGCTSETNTDQPVVEEKSIEIFHHSRQAEDFLLPIFEETSDVEYISDQEKKEWREPLIAVLSKLQPYSEYYEIPDDAFGKSRATAIRWGSDGVALVDINCDGIPEVAELRYGEGTAASCGFDVFDLYTGEKVGGISSGWWSVPYVEYDDKGNPIQRFSDESVSYGEWRTYVDSDGNYALLGQYNYGMNMEHHFSETIWDAEQQIYRTEFKYWYYHVYDRIFETVDNVDVYVEIDCGYYFYDGWKSEDIVSAYEARAYFEDMLSRYKVVEGTQLIVFEWKDIEGFGDITQEELAEKMADVLISSEQKFVVPKY